jgi:antitoxin CptB
MSTDETRLKKLKYRAWHRGFREADLILGPFAEKHVANLTPDQLDAFEVLLDQPDQDLYEWIVEKTATPPEFDGELMSLIKAFRFEAYEARGDDHGG